MQELSGLGLLIATLLQLCAFVMLIVGVALILREVVKVFRVEESTTLQPGDKCKARQLASLNQSSQVTHEEDDASGTVKEGR